jgi:hypothetical protein
MYLAGIPIRGQLVVEIISLVDDDDLATKLDVALKRGVKALDLEIGERETILGVLDDAPEGLSELRAVLLRERESRRRAALFNGRT